MVVASSVESTSSTHVGTTVEAKPQNNNAWHDILPKLKLSGMSLQLAEHCLLARQTDTELFLELDNSGVTLRTERTLESLQQAVQAYFGSSMLVRMDVVDSIGETPEQRRIRVGRELQQQAEEAIANDPFVQQLQQQWGGVILPGSVRPKKD